MSHSILRLFLGDLSEKRAYQQLMKRVNTLPKDHRFAFKKIQHYLYCCGMAGWDLPMQEDLLELFEASAADGKSVSSVIGNDAADFCDALISASSSDATTVRDALNREIWDYFHREGA